MTIAIKDLVVGEKYLSRHRTTYEIVQLGVDRAYAVARDPYGTLVVLSSDDWIIEQVKELKTYTKVLSQHSHMDKGGARYQGQNTEFDTSLKCPAIMIRITEEDGVPIKVELIDKKGF